jgi:hypothetical protein
MTGFSPETRFPVQKIFLVTFVGALVAFAVKPLIARTTGLMI